MNPVCIIERLDSLNDPTLYQALASFLAAFVGTFPLEGELYISECSQETLDNFPSLLYPETSTSFLVAYSKLFGKPERGLRDFITFQAFCEFAHIHTLVAIDEAAEWDYVSKADLDDYLIDVLPLNKISTILISRADVERGLRGQKRFRYFYLRTYMKQIALHDPTPNDVLDIAKGIIATNRSADPMDLFPFSEDFVLSLANLTVRSGHFNTRMFVRGISTALKLSLDWERNTIGIGGDMIKSPDLLDALAEDLKLEDRKGLQPLNITEKAEEIRNKAEAARLVSKLVVSGALTPPTRYMFEILKEEVSKIYQVPSLSDIEVLAYTKKETRIKIYRQIKDLKETSVSMRAMDHLREWIRKKIDSSWVLETLPGNHGYDDLEFR